MQHLYLLLNIGSLSIPLLFSFHPKLRFYKLWKPLIVSLVLTMLIFIPWDVIFTINGVWGFNEAYFLDYKIFSLPIEEWLFFICIPYACVFTHYALVYYFPDKQLSEKSTKILSNLLIVCFFLIALFNYNKWYTVVNFTVAFSLTILVVRYNIALLSKFYLTFLVILIPFFIVNGILTGSMIHEEVVWYNNSENLGIRMFTIPIEDSIYAFSLILMNLFLLELFKGKNATPMRTSR